MVYQKIFFNFPNWITFSRAILTLVFIWMLFNDYPTASLIIVYAVAALTDWFDGFFARQLKQVSPAGAIMDQVFDRFFTIMVFGSLLIYFIVNQSLNYWIVLLFLTVAREMITIPGFIIALIRRKPAYKVKMIGKVTTFVQGFAMGSIILGVNWAVFLVVPSCIMGIIAGIDYLKYCVS